tara:strand:+ start:260 stop:1000 length:741 start_codon:yes stop_codon:yes gene_type:complete
MKKYLHKELCERPRYGGGGKYAFRSARRKSNDEHMMERLPKREGMKKHHVKNWGGKYLNEYFTPLKGILRKNVGRPWDKVFSQICEGLSPRTATGKHVFDHLLNDFVLLKPEWKGKRNLPFRNGIEWTGYYVDPYGILRDNDTPKARARRKKERKKASPKIVEETPFIEYHKINGRWYCVDFVLMGPGGSEYDVLMKRRVTYNKWWAPPRRSHYKDDPKTGHRVLWWRVAYEIREMSKKEIRDKNL